MFSDYLKSHYDWDTTCAEIASKTGADVERALSRPTGTLPTPICWHSYPLPPPHISS